MMTFQLERTLVISFICIYFRSLFCSRVTLRKSFGPPRSLLVVIDDVRDTIQIDAASGNIGGDEDADGAILNS